MGTILIDSVVWAANPALSREAKRELLLLVFEWTIIHWSSWVVPRESHPVPSQDGMFFHSHGGTHARAIGEN